MFLNLFIYLLFFISFKYLFFQNCSGVDVERIMAIKHLRIYRKKSLNYPIRFFKNFSKIK